MSQSPHTLTPGYEDEKPGHHWKEADRVQDYVARRTANPDERAEQFKLMARLAPALTGQPPATILDLGAGFGAVAAAMLEAFPTATAVLLDMSEEMMRVGEEKMAPFAGRYRYVAWDMGEGTLPADLGSFDLIVSSAAIHHLPPPQMERLYNGIGAHLNPGGCFVNLDIVGGRSDGIDHVYEAMEAARRAAKGEPERQPEAGVTHVHAVHTKVYPVEEQLRWLDAGGLQAECFFKRLGFALFGGFKPLA